MKSLDSKLAEIKANPRSRGFILADAKDADMAFGVRAPGHRGYLARRGARPAQFSPEVWSRDEFGYRNLPEFLDVIREIVHQGMVDIMLMSAYVTEQLAIKEGLFRDSHVTPAARAMYPESWRSPSGPNMTAMRGTNVSNIPTPPMRPSMTKDWTHVPPRPTAVSTEMAAELTGPAKKLSRASCRGAATVVVSWNTIHITARKMMGPTQGAVAQRSILSDQVRFSVVGWTTAASMACWTRLHR